MKSTVPGLDGFRALAFLLVLLFHENVLGFGWAGVQMFFVLSGFLITRTLVQSDQRALLPYLKSFYGRRALRIFPVYYAYLLCLGLAAVFLARQGLPAAAETLRQIPYVATYTYNFFHASSGFRHSTTLTHFWSLALEEQFYLLWPLVIFFTPRTTLPRLLAAIVIGGPLVRAVTATTLVSYAAPWATANGGMAVYLLPWCQFDAFAAGGLLNFVHIPRPRCLSLLLLASLPVFGLAGTWLATGQVGTLKDMGFPLYLNEAWKQVWGYSLIAVASAVLVFSVSRRRFFPRLFENPLLAYLGRISYGLYVFHFPMLRVTDSGLHHFGISATPIAKAALDLLLTTVVAAASFHGLERRFLAMKDRFFSPATPPDEGDARPSQSRARPSRA